uniref:Heme A synthase, cytochrome oxidase biogenesis protein Cox15-CtaA n=1 Tax=uncultured bacterium A1Q1_fos_962 TaxID=1256592 RepID=L7W0W1_9BACT|nr:heme A synthase, cytochrome oxidase biogenesis protein Cox15-CtaA [uncultured bacterium A1Q1_fos_962]
MVCATFPLIWIGGLVTTYDAGMAVPDWPETYGYNLFLYPLTTWWAGPWDLFIEHGHRLLASAVGLLTIAWMVVVWFGDSRRWMFGYAFVCLLLVILQGLLGGLRVLFDATTLARIHGCVGPLFFVASVLGAVMTSPTWRAASADLIPSTVQDKLSSYVRIAWVTAGIAYLQLIFGAHLRHVSPDWQPQTFQIFVLAHLVGALILAVHAVWMPVRWRELASVTGVRNGLWHVRGLATLVVTQIALGTFVWRVKYQWPTWVPQPDWFRNSPVQAEGMLQVLTVTAHVALGSLIFALAATIALRGHRQLAFQKPLSPRRLSSSLKLWGLVT